MKIDPVGVDLFHADGLADGQRSQTKLVASFRISVKAPSNLRQNVTGCLCFIFIAAFILSIFPSAKYVVRYALNVGRNAMCVNERCPSVYLVFMEVLIKSVLVKFNKNPFDRLGFLHGKAKRHVFAAGSSKCTTHW
jgi:hypothetical protein